MVNTRRSLLYEICIYLSLTPCESTTELKTKVKLPPEFQNLKTIAQLEACLEWAKEWVAQGRPPFEEKEASPKKYKRKLSDAARKRAIALLNQTPRSTYVRIARVIEQEFGVTVTGQTIKNLEGK